MEITCATTPEEFDEIRALFREYEFFLGVDLQFQQFESELAGLPGRYAPPDAVVLLAKDEGRSVGCGALRRFGPIGDVLLA